MTTHSALAAFSPSSRDLAILRQVLAYLVALAARPVRKLIAVEAEYRLDRLAFDAARAYAINPSKGRLAYVPPVATFAPVQLATASAPAVIAPAPVVVRTPNVVLSAIVTDCPAPAPRRTPLTVVEAPARLASDNDMSIETTSAPSAIDAIIENPVALPSADPAPKSRKPGKPRKAPAAKPGKAGKPASKPRKPRVTVAANAPADDDKPARKPGKPRTRKPSAK